MAKQFFVGVDGGASKSIIRVEDETGNLLGQVQSKPANIRLSVDESWQAIKTGLASILAQHALDFAHHHFYACFGLAGCEAEFALQRFKAEPHGFRQLLVTTDAHIACVAAHQGDDGAIIIAGTGVVGFQIYQNKIYQVGGWGFPHDDEGGGAHLGLLAIKHTCQSLDGRSRPSSLSKTIFAHFKKDKNLLVTWASKANSTEFASMAPFVIEAAQRQDAHAIALLHTATRAVEAIAFALQAQIAPATLKLALTGGVMPFIQPYLSTSVLSQCREMRVSPEVGAMLLIRRHVKESMDA